jgi:hypothetical protein
LAFAFDSLGYAKKLRESGVPQDQAEAHAEAAREFIMTELVTKDDLRTGLDAVRRDLDAKIDNLALRLEGQTLRITIRMGLMLAAGLSILGAVLRLHS